MSIDEFKPTTGSNTVNIITWPDGDATRSAHWRSEAGVAAPKRVVVADDTLSADAAYKLACEGTGILWQGDFQNARLLLQAMARRVERSAERKKPAAPKNVAAPSGPWQGHTTATLTDAFHKHRMTQVQRSRILGMLLIPFEADHSIPLRRAPDVQQACSEVFGAASERYVASLRELQGLIGAHEWRKKGVEIAALEDRIHPHYGVFSPVRGEYIELVAKAPLPPDCKLAFDIGTGTGVLAAVLAKRGIPRIVATDQDPRALRCAHDNIARLKLGKHVEITEADLFPAGRAALVVCNPPWLPGKPGSPLEHAIYDPDSRMLRGFLAGLAEHLAPGGEGWLILSDLAEHLGLRSRETLEDWIAEAGLKVLGKRDIRPKHGKAQDSTDPLHAARSREITSLWRLGATS